MNIIKNKKVIYFGDMMVSREYDTVEEEFNGDIKPELEKHGLLFNKVICTDIPPFKETYDILLFDYGGMSIGNDMLGHLCRHINREAVDKPNTYYVMVSSFTKQAMQDAIQLFGKEKPTNIFLSIAEFAEFYKKYEFLKSKK